MIRFIQTIGSGSQLLELFGQLARSAVFHSRAKSLTNKHHHNVRVPASTFVDVQILNWNDHNGDDGAFDPLGEWGRLQRCIRGRAGAVVLFL